MGRGNADGEPQNTGGDSSAEEIISKLDKKQRTDLEATPISCVVYHDETTQTHHVMRIKLEKSGHQVWFGIAREGFGLELDFPSPWKAFLEDFKEIVDSSLASLFEIQKSKETLARLAAETGAQQDCHSRLEAGCLCLDRSDHGLSMCWGPNDMGSN